MPMGITLPEGMKWETVPKSAVVKKQNATAATIEDRREKVAQDAEINAYALESGMESADARKTLLGLDRAAFTVGTQGRVYVGLKWGSVPIMFHPKMTAKTPVIGVYSMEHAADIYRRIAESARKGDLDKAILDSVKGAEAVAAKARKGRK